MKIPKTDRPSFNGRAFYLFISDCQVIAIDKLPGRFISSVSRDSYQDKVSHLGLSYPIMSYSYFITISIS